MDDFQSPRLCVPIPVTTYTHATLPTPPDPHSYRETPKSGQEDHVEFSYGAARKAYRSVAAFRELLALCEVVVSERLVGQDAPQDLEALLREGAASIDSECEVIPFQVQLEEGYSR